MGLLVDHLVGLFYHCYISDPNSSGSDDAVILELQSSGPQNVLRLRYRHRKVRRKGGLQSEDHDPLLEEEGSSSFFMAVETIPVRLADDEWHRVALTISGSQLQVFLDCKYVVNVFLFCTG